MTITKEHKSIAIVFISIAGTIAFIDFQAWFVEQLYHNTSIPIQALFTIEAVLCSALAIILWRVTRKYLGTLTIKQNNLSQRETEVLEYIITGRTNKWIADKLYIEHSTLKSHINRIYKKLDVSDREELKRRYSAD